MAFDFPSAQETDFLLAVVRPVTDRRLILERAQPISNFDAVARLARRHGVLPLLYSGLAPLEAIVPPEYLARWREEYSMNVVQNLAAASELMTLLGDFDQKQISILPFKGVVLSAAIYGNAGLRPAGDLDLLIFRENLAAASQILLAHSYELQTPVGPEGSPLERGKHELHFERRSDGMIVEIRWRLTQAHFRRDWGMDWLWGRKQSTRLLGTPISTLTAEDTLLLLCLHGSKHGWSRFIWVRDVAQLLHTQPDLNWKQVFKDAKRFGLSRALRLGVLLSEKLAGAPVPGPLRRYLLRDAVANRLSQHIAANFFDDARRIPEDRIPYHIQLLGPGDRARFWWDSRPWRPNQKDRAMIQIPPPLDILYYIVRPARLIRDRFRQEKDRLWRKD